MSTQELSLPEGFESEYLNDLKMRESLLVENLLQPVVNLHKWHNVLDRVINGEGFVDGPSLTFADLTLRIGSDLEDNGKPAGFIKYLGREANLVLREGHVSMLQAYCKSGSPSYANPPYLGGYSVMTLEQSQVNGSDSEEIKRWQHPAVEGYAWFRGNEVKLPSGSSVILYSPWTSVSEQGASPFPVIYTKGIVPQRELVNIAQDYNAYVNSRVSTWV